MIRILTFVFLLSAASLGFGQNGFFKDQYHFKNLPYTLESVQLMGNQTLIGGSLRPGALPANYILKTDLDGNLVYRFVDSLYTDMGLGKLIPENDGSVYVFADAAESGIFGHGGIFYKLEASGTRSFVNEYGNDVSRFFDGEKTEINTYFGIGPRIVITGLDVFHLNPSGSIIWKKTLYRTDSMLHAHIEPIDAENMLIAGAAKSMDNQEIFNFVYQLDINRDSIFSYRFNEDQPVDLTIFKRLDDGNFIMGGNILTEISSDTGRIYLTKLDRNGNQIWENTLDIAERPLLKAIGRRANGGYILGCNDPDQGQVLILCTDDIANLEQTQAYKKSQGVVRINDLVNQPGEGMYAVGMSAESDVNTNSYRGFLSFSTYECTLPLPIKSEPETAQSPVRILTHPIIDRLTFYLRSPGKHDYVYLITDLMGRPVVSWTGTVAEFNSINTRHWPRGSYFLHIKDRSRNRWVVPLVKL